MGLITTKKRLCLWVALALFTSPPVFSQNKLWFPDRTIVAASRGESIYLHASHDVCLAGFSISVRYRPADFLVTAVTTQGTSVMDLPEPIDFWNGNLDTTTGELAFGAIFDLETVFFLPPSGDRTLVRFRLDVLARPGVLTPFELVDGLGKPFPISNLLISQTAQKISPELQAGWLEIVFPEGYLPPLPDAGPDVVASEGLDVLLDGSGSRSPHARPLTYLWTQVAGPLAVPRTDTSIVQPRFSVPPVDGDTSLIFNLTLDDGVTESSDQVLVTALDLDLRTGIVSAPPDSMALVLAGGERAVLFEGVIRWQSPLEDGVWSGIRFTGSGQGDESRLLTSVSLYVDANDNATFDELDRRVDGAISIPTDNGEISFGLAEPMSAGVPMRFYLVANLAPPGISGIPTISGNSGAALLFVPWFLIVAGWLSCPRGGLPRSRRPRKKAHLEQGSRALALAIALLLFLPLFFSACGGGGGSRSETGPGESREVQFGILDAADVSLKGTSSGVSGPTAGLPILGPALDV